MENGRAGGHHKAGIHDAESYSGAVEGRSRCPRADVIDTDAWHTLIMTRTIPTGDFDEQDKIKIHHTIGHNDQLVKYRRNDRGQANQCSKSKSPVFVTPV